MKLLIVISLMLLLVGCDFGLPEPVRCEEPNISESILLLRDVTHFEGPLKCRRYCTEIKVCNGMKHEANPPINEWCIDACLGGMR